jgi:hypothetical protein
LRYDAQDVAVLDGDSMKRIKTRILANKRKSKLKAKRKRQRARAGH